MVLLTDAPVEMEGVIQYRAAHAGDSIRLITDSCYALSGELGGESHTACLYSANLNLVQLLKDALANEIQLNLLRKEDGVFA